MKLVTVWEQLHWCSLLSDRLKLPVQYRNATPKRKALSRKPDHAQPEAADFKWFFQKKNKLRMKHWSHLHGNALGDYTLNIHGNVASQFGNSCLKCHDKVTLRDNCILSTTSPQYLSKEVSSFPWDSRCNDAVWGKAERSGHQKAAELLNNAPYWWTSLRLYKV